jgi:hypothetical protein
MTAKELIENLHADETSELAINIKTIGDRTPDKIGELAYFYKQRNYSQLLNCIRMLAPIARKQYCNPN